MISLVEMLLPGRVPPFDNELIRIEPIRERRCDEGPDPGANQEPGTGSRPINSPGVRVRHDDDGLDAGAGQGLNLFLTEARRDVRDGFRMAVRLEH